MADAGDIKPKFGNRLLKNKDEIFKHNAWDNVEWDDQQEQEALAKINKNSSEMVSDEKKMLFDTQANMYWDKFYRQHQDKFFKDRHWLFTEFPELSSTQSEAFNILEIGCGVGNSVIPILEGNVNPLIKVYCCDFSETAVNLVKDNPVVVSNESRCKPFVCDVTVDWDNAPFEDNSLDAVLLVFVLSAIRPEKMKSVVERILKYLKPGGIVFFRDYGRYDMAQLRFKSGSCLEKNFYVRGDGTQVYFFPQNEVEEMFESCGFEKIESYVDRRLQVNRGKQLTMYRIWIQGKYKKIG